MASAHSWCYHSSAAPWISASLMMSPQQATLELPRPRDGCFCWPGVFQDISNYCKVCQKDRGRRCFRQAIMIPMQLIDGRAYSNRCGRSATQNRLTRSGNKYILTICDYATRYPEAIALSNTEAEKELVTLFSRAGIPDEILTDQGTNFMAVLLQVLYRLLSISLVPRPELSISPYHPQMDGLVERFTLKAMQNCSHSEIRDWDDYPPYLLLQGSSSGVHRVLPLRATLQTECEGSSRHPQGGVVWRGD